MWGKLWYLLPTTKGGLLGYLVTCLYEKVTPFIVGKNSSLYSVNKLVLFTVLLNSVTLALQINIRPCISLFLFQLKQCAVLAHHTRMPWGWCTLTICYVLLRSYVNECKAYQSQVVVLPFDSICTQFVSQVLANFIKKYKKIEVRNYFTSTHLSRKMWTWDIPISTAILYPPSCLLCGQEQANK